MWTGVFFLGIHTSTSSSEGYVSYLHYVSHYLYLENYRSEKEAYHSVQWIDITGFHPTAASLPPVTPSHQTII
jgi:hypothetical protein